MIRINSNLTPARLLPKINRLWTVSATKIESIEKSNPPHAAAPVYTSDGCYTTRGWTDWTRGFQHGSSLLQFDATDDSAFLKLGRRRTIEDMPGHLTHVGVHDHGFNIISTYGNLWRLGREGRLPDTEPSESYLELALKVSGAVQAARWAAVRGGGGYIYSFNGPQSLFIDTMRSCRVLAVAHLLGHTLSGEQDQSISLLGRLIDHATTTARHNVYYGKGRDAYDMRGRVAHESLFNTNNGDYRCPSTQQGFSPFSTWTRGLAWAMCGYAELLEFMHAHGNTMPQHGLDIDAVTQTLREAAIATCDFYIDQTPACGIPYWDTGASRLYELGDYLNRAADPFNASEPVDSSAAAIASQGLLRLARCLHTEGDTNAASRYFHAGLTVLDTLFDEPYLSIDPQHQGLILHAIYHRPNGWDRIPVGRSVPCGESSMWGDYHAREVALYVQRLAHGQPYLVFYGPEDTS